MLNFKQLESLFGDITAADALDCLCWTFSAAQTTIYIDVTRLTLTDLYDMLEFTGLRPARELSLRFYGGPHPGKWWDGNLFTMFLDYFIFAYIKGKKPIVAKALALARQRV